MRKRLVAAVALFACVTGALASCAAALDSDKLLILVTDEKGIVSGTIGEVASGRLGEICRKTGLTSKVVTPASEGDYDSVIRKAVDENPALVILSSPLLETKGVLAAQYSPDMYFVFLDSVGDLNLDGVQDSPNIFSAVFSHEQFGFLAGTAAARMPGDAVAFVGELEYERYIEYEAGFTYAVWLAGSGKTVVRRYIRPEDAQKPGYVDSVFDGMSAEGVKTVFTISARPEITEAAVRRGMRVFSAPVETEGGSSSLVVYKDFRPVMEVVAEEFRQGTFKGQIRVFGAKDGCIGFAVPDRTVLEYVSEETLTECVEKMSQGVYVIPKTRSELEEACR